MIAWKDVTEYGWDGDMIKELHACFVVESKLSDMESKFLTSILPSEASCRRKQHRVHEAAIFLRRIMAMYGVGVTRRGEYLRKTNDTTVMKDNSWIIPVTGYLTRVSYRGKSITMVLQ